MKTERMPWTCRWSEFRPAAPSPMWMEDWMAQWVCLAERQRTGDVLREVGECGLDLGQRHGRCPQASTLTTLITSSTVARPSVSSSAA